MGSASPGYAAKNSNVLMSHVIIPVVLIVIPVPFVFFAPASVRVHSRNVVVHLSAVLAVTRDVTVNTRAVALQPPFALAMVIVRPRNSDCSQSHSAGQRTAEC